MKLKKQFIVHDVMGDTLIVAVGKEAKNFPGVVQCNETAGKVAKLLKSEITLEEIVDRLFEEYNASKEVIAADVSNTLETFRKAGILEE